MRAESMALNDLLQVATVQKEKYGTKDGTLGYTTHHGDEEEDPTHTCCSRFVRHIEKNLQLH